MTLTSSPCPSTSSPLSGSGCGDGRVGVSGSRSVRVSGGGDGSGSGDGDGVRDGLGRGLTSELDVRQGGRAGHGGIVNLSRSVGVTNRRVCSCSVMR